MKLLPLPKPQWQHLLLLLICLFCTSNIHAQYYQFQADSDGQTIFYTARGTSATIVYGDEKYSGEITIPESVFYDGKEFSVVAIGAFAFSECTELTSVALPSSLLSIGDYAFKGCTSLNSIVVPNSVTSIGSNAFDGCTNLASVTLSNSLKSIEYYTFYNCRSLRTLEVPNSVRKIGEMAFQNCRQLSNITLPNSITSIGVFAFDKCSSLESLTIPDQLTSIEQYTFSGCSRLKKIEIPSSVTFIDEWAFYDCSGLKTLTIPNSVNYIGEWAFDNCNALDTVYSDIENPFDIGQYVFERAVKSKATLHIPYGTKEAYQNVTGWDFKNIEEEKPLIYNLVLWAKDGERISIFALTQKPKVTFNDKKFAVECEGVEIEYFELENLARFTYEKNNVPTAIGNLVTEETKFKLDGESLLFSFSKANNMISIYSANGTLVSNKMIKQAGEYALPIANLGTGIYLVKVNGSTYKIVRK